MNNPTPSRLTRSPACKALQAHQGEIAPVQMGEMSARTLAAQPAAAAAVPGLNAFTNALSARLRRWRN